MVSQMTSLDKEILRDLLHKINKGVYQLPDFQRGWVWSDEHIISLLSSVSLSYPVGAFMMLETGNPNVRFHTRPVEGVELVETIHPEYLILDGQQRLTSLFQALMMGMPVTTRDHRGKPIRRWYYMDMKKALDPAVEREQAIISVSEDRKIKELCVSPADETNKYVEEYRQGLFPLNLVYNTQEYNVWRRGYNRYFRQDDSQLDLFDQFEDQIIQRFQQYLVPVIVLKKETPKEAVCQVFEKVNTGGVSLTVFELLTAMYAADDYRLREDWETRKIQFMDQPCLKDLSNDDFLTAVTLLSTWDRHRRREKLAVACNRGDVLALPLEDYRKWADPVTEGFKKAVRFLWGLGIYDSKDIPYPTQMIPLAAILTALGERIEVDTVRRKIARWFWCGVFGELYGSAVRTRFAKDLVGVLNWIDGGREPDTVSESNFSIRRLNTLRTRNSAAYKGLYALQIKQGALDFRSGEPINVQKYFDEAIDIHHIFPKNYCNRQQIGREKDSIVNKTPLSSRTNRIIGGSAPSKYLRQLELEYGISENRLNQILESHLIPVQPLRNDDFATFYSRRQKELVSLVEKATGKKVSRTEQE
ncbi:DUF262 domain-containing protein [Thermoactinomyces mirandus]|uniref:DUF262 domain-containing protein n=1 Tax=Thermoactinomyces mirandus TaxID=2756294 RepID=A0A7W1XRT7_9BACL|nr:DUF262 domain-containing protein [Thermoactinomyces mirandus]MBA4601967.1 DUF262 domain-containing protein [Thermoactinomyces mirandus]